MSEIGGARLWDSSSRRRHGSTHRGHRDGVARTLVFRLLRRISAGRLVVLEAGRRTVFGVDDGLTATVEVHSPKAWRLLLRGSQGLAESYAQRLWDSPDLTAVIAIAACNAHKLDAARRALAPMLRPAQTAREMLLRNTRERSKRDIAAHYDIGDDLFELMLDPTMMYSCALFQRPGMTLQEASLAKLDHICRKLALGEGERVIEIGGGWGGFAIHAAQSTGCHVTTTTISESQYRRIKRRVQEAELQDRVTVLRSDYRDLRGSYDRLVSVEMIEAVGWRRLPLFFARCSELLKRDGVMLLQAIAIDDRAYEVEKAGKSFVNTYIFPNGCLPSMEAIRRNVSRKTDLAIVDVEDITAHYVETLKRWRQSFEAAAAKLSSLGYDERFRRIWKLYLSYCEAGFLSRRILDYQVLLAKPQASSLAPPASPYSSPSSLGGSFPPVINGAGDTRK